MSKTPPAKLTKKAPEFTSTQQTHRGDANTPSPHEFVDRGGKYVPKTPTTVAASAKAAAKYTKLTGLPQEEPAVRALYAICHPTWTPRPKHWYFLNPTSVAIERDQNARRPT